MVEYITNFIYLCLIRISTPIAFACFRISYITAGGLLNMAAEAMMLTSSLAGVMFSALFHNVWLGILLRNALLRIYSLVPLLCNI